MDHAITLGDLFKWALIAGGVFAVLAGLYGLLAAFGRGMSR